MLENERPIEFPIAKTVILLLLLFGFSLPFIGVKNALIPMLLSSVCLLVYFNLKGFNFYTSLLLLLPYQTAFDSTVFNFTDLNLRIWYIIPIIAYIKKFFELCFLKKQLNFKWFLLILFFIFLSIDYLVLDEFNGRLSNAKYWLFTIGLLYVLVSELKNEFLTKTKFLSGYFISIFFFVGCFGLLQTVSIPLGLSSSYMVFPFNIRPDAFFSETTWYGLYCFFGIILFFFYCNKYGYDYSLIFVFVFIVGIFISNTRNVYVSMALSLVFAFFFLLIRFDTKNSTQRIFIFLISMLLLSISVIVLKDIIGQKIIEFLIKFALKDNSAYGRMEGFRRSFELISESPIFGHGFNWDESSIIYPGGTAIGAKSFNLFLQIFHIFGIIGFIPFIFIVLSLLLRFFGKAVYFGKIEYKFSFYMFLSFLSMSFFGPLHQFPFGMVMVAIAIMIFYAGEKRE